MKKKTPLFTSSALKHAIGSMHLWHVLMMRYGNPPGLLHEPFAFTIRSRVLCKLGNPPVAIRHLESGALPTPLPWLVQWIVPRVG